MSDELKRILYAEDERDIQEIVQISLEEIGHYDLKICSSGEELLEEYEQYAPDLILMDVMMPGLDGVATFERLKDMPEYRQTPVIFMTAKVQVNEVQQYKEIGALDVISKPFNPMELPGRLEGIWQSYIK